MCYSAMVRRDLDKAAREFGAYVDIESFVRLYAMRAKDPDLKIPFGMDRYFVEKGGAAGRAIQKSIETYRSFEEARKKQELEDLEAEIKEIEARLKVKVTKTHQKALDVKTRKREKLLGRAKAAVQAEPKDAYRIYPFYFAPVVMVEKDKRIITPMRYRILPSTGVEIPSKYNVFNARRDSLFEARSWKATFGKTHAIFPFMKFFEWVEDEKGRKVELSFSPDGFDSMWAASLYDEYRDKNLGLIRSFAMVTDEPPPEVAAAGHDRCPVFLDHALLEDWLHPEKLSLKELDRLLDRKEPTHYSHALAA